MKKAVVLLACSSLLLSGCTLFKSPSAERSRRNDDSARMADDKRREYEREDAIKARADAFERQGMTREQAWSAAQVGSSGMRTR